MKLYAGKERRSMKMCPLHPELVEQHRRTDVKVDKLLENQERYMKDTAELRDIVTNGLKSKVEDIAKTTAEIKLRADTVDTFSWFINLVNGFKEKLMVNVIKIVILGGVLSFVWAIMSASGNKVGIKLLEKLF